MNTIVYIVQRSRRATTTSRQSRLDRARSQQRLEAGDWNCIFTITDSEAEECRGRANNLVQAIIQMALANAGGGLKVQERTMPPRVLLQDALDQKELRNDGPEEAEQRDPWVAGDCRGTQKTEAPALTRTDQAVTAACHRRAQWKTCRNPKGGGGGPMAAQRAKMLKSGVRSMLHRAYIDP